MEDPLAPTSRALYVRLGSDCPPDGIGRGASAGLFTRPAVLALRDETPRGVPVRALNRACRMLLDSRRAAGGSGEMNDGDGAGGQSIPGGDGEIAGIARRCGFADAGEFTHLFRSATGWDPGDWRERFG